MLTQMYVKDFVLIDNINLDFKAGMSAFTGETGAGKSLLIDAIGILRGDRINGNLVKQGKEKAIIEGVFQIETTHIAYTLLENAGYAMDENMVIITREFSKDGKSTSRINQRTTTVSFIKEVLSSLIDIHSQHDSQYLLNTKYHLSLLDAFVSEPLLVKAVKEAYQHYHQIQEALQAALANDYNEDDLEFLTFQLNEIDEANLKEDELEELEATQKKMMAFEKITTRLNGALNFLNGDEGACPKLYEACHELEGIHEDDDIHAVYEKLMEYYYQIDEQHSFLQSYLEQMEFDDAAFAKLQDRIFLIHKIIRKYGGSLAEVQTKRNELETKIDVILHRSDYIKKQEVQLQAAFSNFQSIAQSLSLKRHEQASLLEAQITAQLMDLKLSNARFSVAFTPIESSSSGIEKVEFLISMNKGEALKPLSTSASGGELSRLMLGLKTIFTRLQGIETVIFDEIDTGVSGSVAFSIGKKMQQLASDAQVFCVTHLAQVAACASSHYLVAKEQTEDSTTSSIFLLEDTQRVEQLALIASDSTSAHAIEAAKELFTKAQAKL